MSLNEISDEASVLMTGFHHTWRTVWIWFILKSVIRF